LAHEKNPNISEEPNEVVAEFKKHMVDTELFYDKYAGAKFAQYLFRIHEEGPRDASLEAARELLEEAQLFVEASHACYQKMQVKAPAAE
jgi:sulfite reductase (ferredoxin)